jgi:hypothetical protein
LVLRSVKVGVYDSLLLVTEVVGVFVRFSCAAFQVL